MKIIDSEIKRVTVYSDRAQITKVGKTETQKGETTLRFENLPEYVEAKSIQVNGAGAAVLRDIKFKEVYFEITQDEKKKKLHDETLEIQYKIREISDQINHAKKEKEFVENIVAKITGETKKTEGELNPDNWIKMVEFYRNKLSASDNEIRNNERKLIDLKNKLDKINREIIQLGTNEHKTKKVVDVTIFSEEKGSVVLSLTYIVYGPSWQPNYNLRVDSENKKVLIEYNALITQNTDEDWNNVSLTLSTAKVQIGGNIPVLAPWYVNKFRPAPPKALRSEFKKSKKRSMKKDIADSFSMMDFDEEMTPMAGKGIMPKPSAKVQEKATSSVFEIQGKSKIESNNDTHKVTITLEKLSAEFDYTSVPKANPYAYLKAKITNNSDFPMLSGQANVFFDNNFVTETYLKLVLPEEKFELSLGVDEGIKIEHKELPRFNKDEGLFNKKHKKTFEYEVKIKNAKKTEETITIKDNIPMSLDDDISVDLTNPKYKEDTDTVKLSNQGILERKTVIKPGEEIILPLKFIVEYPKDMTVTGV